MPIKKSAKKNLRKSLRRRIRNLSYKKKIKNLLKQMRKLILEKEVEKAKKLLPQIYKLLDKAAKRGIIKNGAAARKKSKIAKLLFKLEK